MRDPIRQTATRRNFLQLAGGGAAALVLGDLGIAHATGLLSPEAVSTYAVTADSMRANLGTRTVSTIGFNDSLPGPLLRVTEGQRLHVDVTNNLNASTTIHWHGIPIVNKMDGVPGLTQPPIASGGTFSYDFKVPVSGTYWYHSHSGSQNDRGMYGPLIADARSETLSYDREVILVIDDWRDGIGKASRELLSLYECHTGFERRPLAQGHPPEEPTQYPLHLINGKAAGNPQQISVKAGEVVRFRIINAGAATIYRVATGGHRMRVTHADGQPVVPVDVDALDIGMAERYDVLVHANHSGVWQFAAVPSSRGPLARAVVRYNGSTGAAPPAGFRPKELKGKVLGYRMLRTNGGYGIPSGKPDMQVYVGLNSRFGSFYITFNGRVLPVDQPFHVPRNTHARFIINNNSAQVHPMHLHGHFFQLANGTGNGPMKDTLILAPSQTYTVDWVANNPGKWMFHCHNLYHMLNGLMNIISVA
jgi:FtsP/CotA-like multicopper oxidase with cupredoxin domain